MTYKLGSLFASCLIISSQYLLSIESNDLAILLQQAPQKLQTETAYLSKEDTDYIKAFPFSDYKIAHAERQGFFYVDDMNDIIKKLLQAGIAWEPDGDALIRRYVKPNTVALDIGAHIGTHTVTMSRCVGQGGKVIAFEPQNKIYRELVMNLKLNQAYNVIPLHYSVGAENKMSYLDNPIPDNEGARFVSSKESDEKIAMRTIDSFKIDNISFIKIDVENYEASVLEGARQTILKQKPVMLIEIQGNHVQASQVSQNKLQHMENKRNEVITQIKSMGYQVSHFNCDDYLAIPN